MEDLEFLKQTKGFSGIVFDGLHSQFSIGFIQACKRMYKDYDWNALEDAQAILETSWDYCNIPDVWIHTKEYLKLKTLCSQKFLLDNLGVTVINKCLAVLECGHGNYKKSLEYKCRKKEAKNKLANKAFRKEVFAKYGKKCSKCGTTKHLAIDHVISLYNGGEDEIENLQILCKTCNSSKGTDNTLYR